MNGVPCRLLDIQELLSDTGVGRQQHVIISQGQIDAVLNARPEDRRLIIEEAAGVLKFRRRKEKAERRLTSTEGNLTRLQDLLREVRRQLRPLERQADAARRYGAVVAELTALRRYIAGQELARLQAPPRGERPRPTRARPSRSRRFGRCCAGSTPMSRRPSPGCRRWAATTSVTPSCASSRCASGPAGWSRCSPNGARGHRARPWGVGRSGGHRHARGRGGPPDRASWPRSRREPPRCSPTPSGSQAAETRLAADREAFAGDWADGVERAERPRRRGAGRAVRDAGRASSAARPRPSAAQARLDARCPTRSTGSAPKSERLGAEIAAAEAAEGPLAEQLAAAEAAARVDAEAALASSRGRVPGRRDRASCVDGPGRGARPGPRRGAGPAGAERLAGVDGVVGTLLETVDVDAGWEAAFEAAVGEAVAAVLVDGRRRRRGEPSHAPARRRRGRCGARARRSAAASRRAAAPPSRRAAARLTSGRTAPESTRLLDALIGGAVATERLGGGGRHRRRPSRARSWSPRPATASVRPAGGSAPRAPARPARRSTRPASAPTRLAAGDRRPRTERQRRPARPSATPPTARPSSAGSSSSTRRRTQRGDAMRCAGSTPTDGTRRPRPSRSPAHVAELDERAAARPRPDGRARGRRCRRSKPRSTSRPTGAGPWPRRGAGWRRRRRPSARCAATSRCAAPGSTSAGSSCAGRLAQVEERLDRDVAERREAEARRVEIDRRRARHRSADRAGQRPAGGRRGGVRRRLRGAAAGPVRGGPGGGRGARRAAPGPVRRPSVSSARRASGCSGPSWRTPRRGSGSRRPIESLRRDLDCEPDAAMAAERPELAETVTPAARARELERDLRIMGPINPLALEEFEALQERHDVPARPAGGREVQPAGSGQGDPGHRRRDRQRVRRGLRRRVAELRRAVRDAVPRRHRRAPAHRSRATCSTPASRSRRGRRARTSASCRCCPAASAR